ncbi:MAG: coenzyme A pyrophosphatase, partial [Ardenticatenales bacterium]|nr:coenzyme A pyrophosphatase [Ardenticatenales bacterium]
MQNPFESTIESLRQRLREPLPGRAAFMTMAPENPRHKPVEVARQEGCREGGVLLLLYP